MIKNKIWIIILPFFLMSLNALSQVKIPKTSTLNQFLASKTYIVKEDAMFSEFNSCIEIVAKNHWKITPYEIISIHQYEKLCKQTEASFLMIVEGEYTGMKDIALNVLTLVMGSKSGNINQMPEILSVPLNYLTDEDDDEKLDYKLGAILKGMQYAVKNILNESVTPQNLMSVLSKNMKFVKEKELWLLESDLAANVNTLEKIQKVYPYKVVIVRPEDIREAVDENRENIVILHQVGNKKRNHALCVKILIACKDGQILYGSYHIVSDKEPSGFSINDFKKIQ